MQGQGSRRAAEQEGREREAGAGLAHRSGALTHPVRSAAHPVDQMCDAPRGVRPGRDPRAGPPPSRRSALGQRGVRGSSASLPRRGSPAGSRSWRGVAARSEVALTRSRSSWRAGRSARHDPCSHTRSRKSQAVDRVCHGGSGCGAAPARVCRDRSGVPPVALFRALAISAGSPPSRADPTSELCAAVPPHRRPTSPHPGELPDLGGDEGGHAFEGAAARGRAFGAGDRFDPHGPGGAVRADDQHLGAVDAGDEEGVDVP